MTWKITFVQVLDWGFYHWRLVAHTWRSWFCCLGLNWLFFLLGFFWFVLRFLRRNRCFLGVFLFFLRFLLSFLRFSFECWTRIQHWNCHLFERQFGFKKLKFQVLTTFNLFHGSWGPNQFFYSFKTELLSFVQSFVQNFA